MTDKEDMKVKDFIDKHPEFFQSDILYQGKCKETRKLVYGYYYKEHNKTYIIDGIIEDNVSHLIEVIPETVRKFEKSEENFVSSTAVKYE